MKKYILYCVAMLLMSANAGAQDSYADRVKRYVDQYYPLAIAEQKSSGIPASITLGQGILETEAGNSELMVMANNHFGIKCSNGWAGETFNHDDDLPHECFKKYNSAAESYHDHSAHLKRNQRYASLFTLSQTDYASWAIGLKRCGYATNPQYAQKLIKIIEDFKLQDYTYSAMDTSVLANYPTIPAVVKAAAIDQPLDEAPPAVKKKHKVPAEPEVIITPDSTEETMGETDTIGKAEPQAASTTALKNMADNARAKVMQQQQPIAQKEVVPVPPAKIDTPKKYPVAAAAEEDKKHDIGKVVEKNGMRAFYALKGEMLLQYAVKYNVRYPRLLEMNDLADAPLPFSMYVYLEKKLTSGMRATHTMKDGETLLMASQEEGVQMKRIMLLNYLNPGDEPMTGAVIQLQTAAERKPDTKLNPATAHSRNNITTDNELPKENGDYIAISRPTAADSATQADREPEEGAAERAATGRDGAKNGELSDLKAELDKVVYADNSKLKETKATAAPKKQPVAAAAKPVVKKVEKFYKVKRGDTVSGIAKKNQITVRQLLKWNDDIDADDVRAGQTLRVKP